MNKVNLRDVSKKDRAILYDWQCIPGIRSHFNNVNLPSLSEHISWFEKRIREEYPFYIISFNGIDCGFVRLESSLNCDFDVSILVDPVFSGNAIGSTALERMILLNKGKSFEATIKEVNKGSIKCFERAGFRLVGEKFYYPFREAN